MTGRFVNDRTLATAARVAEIAGDCGLSPVTFAVAWTLTRDFVASTIVGVTSVEQLGEHLAAADAKIPTDALAAVDALSKEIRHPMA
jgi:aryl-alcohol dehydrogenase-like predicted oxidoreductase